MSNETRSGQISVNTKDIFPIIKKWLYSEHDIFIRELVSNACDAITKRQTLARTQNVELPDAKVEITLDKKNKTLTISDNGVGMSEAEVEKYIAQLAFSGAEEFVSKMKEAGAESDADIIGKFGLGFYSAFMVADKVEVESLSHTKGSAPTRWICEGDTDYTFEASDKKEVGTSITLHIGKDGEEFLNAYKTRETLKSHCSFMPYPVFLNDLDAKEQAKNAEVKEGEEKKEYTPELTNNTEPLWKKDPSTLKDEDYKAFFKDLFPYEADPLFWIHLKVDHPFTLEGILYFPRLNPTKPVQDNNIKLYSKQVFVSDNVKNIIPEFLGLLKGGIDSVDIPLNVSRSSLQGDPNIKRISNYITKKVAEALKKLFKNDRERFEAIWPDIQLFTKYGVISDTKFDELVRKFVLFKNSEDKLVTASEYKESIPEKYKEKVGDKIVYFEKEKSNAGLRKQLLTEGIHVIETEEYIDPHFMQHVEMHKQEETEVKFVSIDSEFENLLSEENSTDEDIKIKDIFTEFLVPKTDEKTPANLEVEIKKYANAEHPAYFKVDEQMKRFQQMTKNMGQDAAGSFPIKKTLVVNPASPLIQNTYKIWEKGDKELANKLCHLVQDLASISSDGLGTSEKEAFVKRSEGLLQELTNFAL